MARLLRPALAATAASLALASSAHAFGVTGYVLVGQGHDAKVIARAAGSVTDYGIDGATLAKDGGSFEVPATATAGLAAAHAAGKPASLLLSNYDDDLQDFSPKNASGLFNDPAHRAAVIAALQAQVAAGWDGITLDLESLDPNDRDALTSFVTQLHAALPATATLDIDVPAGTDPTDPYLKPFDLPSLAAQVDHVSLMAYDQHYAGGPAGPVGGLPWFRSVVAAATAQIPAGQLRVGVAGYGYRWRKGKPTVTVSVKQARKLAGKRAHWNAKQGEWNATLPNHTTLWWSDRRSVAARRAIAVAAGAQGIAEWELTSADPLPTLAVTPTPVAPSPTPTPTPTPVCPATASAAAARIVACPLAAAAVDATGSCPCPGPIRAPTA
ncbi:MAG: glycosyl hydrolase family 18 protein [Solirubrobacteraceae bacterium]